MVLASAVRFRPVLLTAITTVIGLAPMAMGMDIDFSRDSPVVFGSESGQFLEGDGACYHVWPGRCDFFDSFHGPHPLLAY